MSDRSVGHSQLMVVWGNNSVIRFVGENVKSGKKGYISCLWLRFIMLITLMCIQANLICICADTNCLSWKL